MHRHALRLPECGPMRHGADVALRVHRRALRVQRNAMSRGRGVQQRGLLVQRRPCLRTKPNLLRLGLRDIVLAVDGDEHSVVIDGTRGSAGSRCS